MGKKFLTIAYSKTIFKDIHSQLRKSSPQIRLVGTFEVTTVQKGF
ncbi:hypothetical protein GXM_04291 [Nostoc sphaeroides CCNUC1]|uniref:Uncharacterized protein n=1 Tax=Nostoc sphaeroides CCNUC1 TaxID=2653204 RepID=A0A5P8W2C9_9NOSO|nr:hypothetical protein GXM_04291 [Nostoc sphaeroides CCNUC1]